MGSIQEAKDFRGEIFRGLNAEQAEAATHVDGPLLILAGAGSGKTRVLVHRIAYLILEAGIPPWAILGITFTNKAANEMKSRVEALLPSFSGNIWISTFHSACVRILRRDIERIGVSRYFTIYDADDQLSLIKECLKELNLPAEQFAPKSVLDQIGRAKDNLLGPDEYMRLHARDPHRSKIADAYSLYDKKLRKLDALDFDDIILKTIRLLNECADVREYYQNRFRYVLVDEYQDTNTAQYTLITLLSGKWKNLCVVGDDDQSIYGWRGANIGNILDFEKEYADAKVIKLEQNYRSTKTILMAANDVINKNDNRKSKRLWTENERGEAICCVELENEYDEAEYVSKKLKALRAKHGASYNEFAVLYRINAQSRAVENMLAREGIPYRIIGGFRFYDRKEIKDVIAYLRLIQNPDDDVSFKRVINVPRRGVGAVTLDKLESRAAELNLSLFGAASAIALNPGAFPEFKSAADKLRGYVDLLGGLGEAAENSSVASILETTLALSGMSYLYESDPSEEAKTRLENIMEFKTEIAEFEKSYEGDGAYYNMQGNGGDGGGYSGGDDDEYGGGGAGGDDGDDEGYGGGDDGDDEGYGSGDGGDDEGYGDGGAGDGGAGGGAGNATLSDFLAHISLISDVDKYDESEEKVSLMTVHSAKGLEYETVFVVGAEEGIFPGLRTMSDPLHMEEERRLCYVAITRAKKRLFFTHAYSRTLFGNTTYNKLSRFVSDIPENLISDGYNIDGSMARGRRGTRGGRQAGGEDVTRSEHEAYGEDWRENTASGKYAAPGRHGASGWPEASGKPAAFGRPATFGAAAAFGKPARTNMPGGGSGGGMDSAGGPAYEEYDNGRKYAVGDAVGHKKFGSGIVTNRYLDKSDYILEIDFPGAGMKRFIESMVKLRIES